MPETPEAVTQMQRELERLRHLALTATNAYEINSALTSRMVLQMNLLLEALARIKHINHNPDLLCAQERADMAAQIAHEALNKAHHLTCH